MVNINDSYNVSSKYSENASMMFSSKPTRGQNMQHQQVLSSGNYEVELEKIKQQLFLPEDDLLIENKIKDTTPSNTHKPKETKLNYEPDSRRTILNRISEEAVAQSGETLTSKSQRSHPKSPTHPQTSPNPQPLPGSPNKPVNPQFLTFEAAKPPAPTQKGATPQSNK